MKQINIDALYYEFLDSDESSAPESVTVGYCELKGALDRYLDAVTEYEWKAGFSYAVKMMEEREGRENAAYYTGERKNLPFH